MEFSSNIEYHGLEIPETEEKWLGEIFNALERHTITSDIIKFALELAWKRGYACGAR